MSKDKEIKKEDKSVPELEAKMKELENNWKRALADYINLEKRIDEEKTKMYNYANEQLVRKMLGVLDNLENLVLHNEDQGLLLTLKDFKKVLEDMGLSTVKAQGKNFDPSTMEAIGMVEGEKNKVINVLSKGYFLKENLIRPARVNVGQGKLEE